MIKFPDTLHHDSGFTMSLDTSRILLAFIEPPRREGLERSLREHELLLDTQKEKQVGSTFPAINHTKNRFWVCSQNGKPIHPDQFQVIKEKFEDQLEWIGPVYRLADTKGLGGLVCPFPNVLLIKQKGIYKDKPEMLTQLLLHYGLREIPEKSNYLGDYRYFSLSDSKNGEVYSLRDTLLEKEGESISEVCFENMPFLSPLAYQPLDTLFSQQWNMSRVKAGGWAPTGWDISTGNGSIVIAILDTGCDLYHPDLLFFNHGINLGSMSGDGSPAGDESGFGHGTCCAGIAAARIGNQIGVSGMAGNCPILPIAFENSTDAEVAAGIRYAADNGARVISMSFGEYGAGENVVGPNGETGPSGWNFAVIDPSITYAASIKGCVLCAASGNENNGNFLRYPARHSLVIAVGASDQSDHRKSLTSPDGQNWGSNFSSGLSVLAPGVLIPTTDIRGAKGFDSGDYFLTFSGTSGAAPHVAGLAALILSLHPNLSNETVRFIIETTAEKIGGYTYTAASHPSGSWSDEAGYGRINVLAALECAQNIFSFPPFVHSVEAYAIGNSGPVRKYRAYWEYAFGQFQLHKESDPIVPNQQEVKIIVEFACPTPSGGLSCGMESMSLTLTGKNPNDQHIFSISIPMNRVDPTKYSGSYWPENFGSAYEVELQIDGTDKLKRFSLRNPKGDVLDKNPQTWASADQNNPPYYPYLNYEPGTDINHKLTISTPVMNRNIDRLEINDDFLSASRIDLPKSTIGEAVFRNEPGLTLHNATDEDYFRVQFEPGVGSGSGSGLKPSKVIVSRYLGLSVSCIPDTISVQLSSGDNFVDLIIYQSDNYGHQVISYLPRASKFIASDLSVFEENIFFVRVKNTNYPAQGALEYGISFMFTPGFYHTSMDHNAPAYRARPTVAAELLSSYYERIDLPRPQEMTANMLPYGSQSFAIPDIRSFIRRSEKYFQQSQSVNRINAITESKSQSEAIIVEIISSLGDLAFSSGRKSDAKELYTKCLLRISKLEKSTASSSKIQAFKKAIQKRLTILKKSKPE